MSENSSQPAPRPSGEHSGEKHYEQGGGRRNNRSRNNRKRRDRQPDGGEISAAQGVQRPSGVPPVTQGNMQTGQRPPRERQDNQRWDGQRQDFHNNQRRNKPNRPQPNPNARPQDRSETAGTSVPNRSAETSAVANAAVRTNNPNPPRQERLKESRNWGRHIKSEETYEDVRRENERIEKEIWLEIAGIHTCKLD